MLQLLDKPPRIHKFPCKDALLDKPLKDALSELPSGIFTPAPGTLIHPLHDEMVFQITPDASLQVLHTPGHTEDSASFLFKNGEGTSLFTADTVLGQGTAVFTDLKALISSLERCIDRVQQAKPEQVLVKLFCGHGPAVDDGVKKMHEYIQHRLEREHQILQALENGKPQSIAE